MSVLFYSKSTKLKSVSILTFFTCFIFTVAFFIADFFNFVQETVTFMFHSKMVYSRTNQTYYLILSSFCNIDIFKECKKIPIYISISKNKFSIKTARLLIFKITSFVYIQNPKCYLHISLIGYVSPENFKP